MLTRNVATTIRSLVLTFAVLCALSASLHAASKTGFTSFIVGNPADAQPSRALSPKKSGPNSHIAGTSGNS